MFIHYGCDSYGRLDFKNGFGSNTYKYDEIGNHLEKNKYIDSSLVEKTIYKYDKRNRLVETNRYEGSGRLEKTYTYKYDESWDQIVEENDGISKIYKYDEKGNLIKTIYYNDGKYSDGNSYEYDENNNLIEERDALVIYKYSDLDKIGNWKKSTLYQNNKPINIIEREIQYY